MSVSLLVLKTVPRKNPGVNVACSFSRRWLTQKGVRQKKLNEWLGIKNENTEE